MTTYTPTRPSEGLASWLGSHELWCEVREHPETFTALSTARAQGGDVRTFMKVVAVEADDGRAALVVVESPDRVDLRKVHRIMGATSVRLLSEAEMRSLAPDCDPGALPAIGELFGLATYADYAVHEHPRIGFEAGNHRCSVAVDRRAWERCADVTYGDLIVEEEGPWAPV